MHLLIGARTDIGRVRGNNEDCFGVDPELNLFVVSDGIGGAEHGEIASQTAVNAILKHCREAAAHPTMPLEGRPMPMLGEKTNRLASAIRVAHRSIYQSAATNPALHGMGATVVAAWVNQDRLSLAHVGDSRAYRLRGSVLEQLTQDHSLVAEQVRMGLLTDEQAAGSSLRTVLVRALGHSEQVEADAAEYAIEGRDSFLLCTDGLTRMVTDAAIVRAIRGAPQAQAAVDRLIALANEAGGEDNVTVVLVQTLGV
ncbi:MAG TPA: Stp1/IreP family PP2C-type Ser/Thr phosphatase [Candidatus Acidoferrales bacterium]|nr:Stp1/IreP family PP2C-type Ser/Thr phosphatase [Candidatus Acidoferrales bacterium]